MISYLLRSGKKKPNDPGAIYGTTALLEIQSTFVFMGPQFLLQRASEGHLSFIVTVSYGHIHKPLFLRGLFGGRMTTEPFHIRGHQKREKERVVS